MAVHYAANVWSDDLPMAAAVNRPCGLAQGMDLPTSWARSICERVSLLGPSIREMAPRR